MLDDAGGRFEALSEFYLVVDRPEVVGNDPSVGAAVCVTELNWTESPQGRGQPEGEKLERDRRRERLHELVRRRDHHEALRRRSHDLLPGVGGTASLYEPACRIDLVGSVDGDVEPVEVLERLDQQAEISCPLLRLGGGRDAADLEALGCKSRKEEGDRRARAESDRHSFLDEPSCFLRRGALLALLSAHAWISSQLIPRTSSQ